MTDNRVYGDNEEVRPRRLKLFAAAVLLFAFVAAFVWWPGRDEQEEEPGKSAGTESASEESAGVLSVDEEAQERIGLEVEKVALRPLSAQISVTGVVQPNQARAARIRALSSGVITRVLARPGDRVEEGRALLSYDNIELGQARAEHAAAAAALQSAESEAEVAKLSLERANQLVSIGGIAEAEQQKRRAEYAAAQAEVRTFQAQVANVKQTLKRFGASDGASGGVSQTTLRAPFTGVLLELPAAAGETVSPERELGLVVDLSTVWVQANVYERDLAAIAEGNAVRVVVDAYPGEVFEGRVASIGASLDPASRTAQVRCEVKNPGGRLRLQMFARLDIASGGARERLAVPRDAVQQIDGEPSVFVRTGETSFERRTVELGLGNQEWVEVTSGLSPGDAVVTKGALMLKSKMKASEFAEEEQGEEK
ncbi:efflux RND transporter periplasmic adaptor subunit [Luteitalea sp.]